MLKSNNKARLFQIFDRVKTIVHYPQANNEYRLRYYEKVSFDITQKPDDSKASKSSKPAMRLGCD